MKLKNQSKFYKQNNSNRLKQNKSDLITQSNPFQDISNLNSNRSSIFLRQKDALNQRVSETSNLKYKPISDNQNFISLKFRIPLNQFSEDYYIFNLQLKPQLHLSDLVKYFFDYPPLQKIREKRKSHQNQILEINDSQEWQFTGNFSLSNQKLQNHTSVRQIFQTLESSNKKQDFIDFSFDWVPKPLQSDPSDMKNQKNQTPDQNCCILM